MQNILYSVIEYLESLDFLSEYKISGEFVLREAKNITVSVIYNSSSPISYGEGDNLEYIIQIDITSRHRVDSYITTSELINHFLILRSIDVFKFSKNGNKQYENDKENNKENEIEGILHIEESMYSFKDNYEESGYQRNTIRYLSIFSKTNNKTK